MGREPLRHELRPSQREAGVRELLRGHPTPAVRLLDRLPKRRLTPRRVGSHVQWERLS